MTKKVPKYLTPADGAYPAMARPTMQTTELRAMKGVLTFILSLMTARMKVYIAAKT